MDRGAARFVYIGAAWAMIAADVCEVCLRRGCRAWEYPDPAAYHMQHIARESGAALECAVEALDAIPELLRLVRTTRAEMGLLPLKTSLHDEDDANA